MSDYGVLSRVAFRISIVVIFFPGPASRTGSGHQTSRRRAVRFPHQVDAIRKARRPVGIPGFFFAGRRRFSKHVPTHAIHTQRTYRFVVVVPSVFSLLCSTPPVFLSTSNKYIIIEIRFKTYFWFVGYFLYRYVSIPQDVFLSWPTTNHRNGKPNEEHVRPAGPGNCVSAQQWGGRPRARHGHWGCVHSGA